MVQLNETLAWQVTVTNWVDQIAGSAVAINRVETDVRYLPFFFITLQPYYSPEFAQILPINRFETDVRYPPHVTETCLYCLMCATSAPPPEILPINRVETDVRHPICHFSTVT